MYYTDHDGNKDSISAVNLLEEFRSISNWTVQCLAEKMIKTIY